MGNVFTSPFIVFLLLDQMEMNRVMDGFMVWFTQSLLHVGGSTLIQERATRPPLEHPRTYHYMQG